MRRQHLLLAMVVVTMTGCVASECPATYDTHPVILMSMDGFRADYLNRGLTPTLQTLADRGVHALYMKPSYPTVTFPNHYTIVTGHYPESHGIIANKFYDPEFYATFDVGEPEQLKARWWGGEPIWNTVTRQGKLSATYFWPGSDTPIGGSYPTYWLPYNWTTPFEDRVDKVLEWVSLPVEERPVMVTLYINEPDHTAHNNGPDSTLVNNELEVVDQVLNRLVEGLAVRGLTDCVNLLVVADHGMASSVGIENYVIKLADYIPNIYDLANLFLGAFARLDPKDDSEAGEASVMEPLSCVREGMRVYLREDLPTRHHFSNNRRIEDVVLDVDPGLTVSVSYEYDTLGQHGYDNYFSNMNALFVAVGPEFREKVEVPSFHNIELYNLMCHLAGVEPAPNNGTLGSLYHVLRDPPTPPALPQENRPPTSQFPTGDLGPLLNMSACDGDLTAPEEWLSALNLTEAQQEAVEELHLPWGIPLSGSLPAALTLLHHTDHVTAYSESLKMPLWTSLSVEAGRTGTPPQPWTSDVRLQPSSAQTCPSYLPLQPLNTSMFPLFPPAYSEDSSLVRVPYLTSNAVPVSQEMALRWGQLMDQMVPIWLDSLGPLNIVLGPVFDNNADSFPDNFTSFSTPEVPSDLFAVLTRCQLPVATINLCPPASLDATAYIFPQSQFITNCLERERYAWEFSAKVHDVEMVTGLNFYPDLDFANRTSLTLKIHQDIWPLTL